MAYAVKAAVADPRSTEFEFLEQKTMYGGRRIAAGDRIFVFASENEGGAGLVGRGIVRHAEAVPRKPGVARQNPRVSILVADVVPAKRRLSRAELKAFVDWNDGRAETELNFKFHRQATDKIVGLSDAAAAYLLDDF